MDILENRNSVCVGDGVTVPRCQLV